MSKKKSWEFEDAEGTEKPEGWYKYRDYCLQDGLSEDEANRAADEEFGCNED